MPRKTSFCNAALLRSDIKRYWPLLFLYVAVWVVILPMQILSASRECDGVAEGIMTVLQLRQHNVIIQSIPASVVMSLLFGCFAAMAVWSYLMSGRTVGLMHALPVTRTQAFFSHVLSALGALTAGNVLIFLLTALCSAGFSYVDWAALGTWLLLTELMALFFFALGSLCAMVTGWLLAVPVLYGAMNVIALLLYAVISTMTQMFYFGYSSSDIPEFITWLTPVGRIWDAVANGGAQPIDVQFREPIGTQSYQRVQLPASAFSTCIIYAAVGIALLALVWWLYKKRPSETAGDAMSFRWLRPIARWSIGLCGGLGLGLFLRYTAFIDGGFACLLICQLVMGVICFFAAQMLLQKTFRVFRRSWKELAALAAAMVALTLAIRADILGVQYRVPDVPQVDNVRVMVSRCEGGNFLASDSTAIETVTSLHRAILDQGPENADDSRVLYVSFYYTMKNGQEIRRNYGIAEREGAETYRKINQLLNLPQARSYAVGINDLTDEELDTVRGGFVEDSDTGFSVDLTREQALALCRAAQQDVHGHVGGVGAKLGVVDAAGGERAGRDEAVRAGIEWDAALGQCLGDSGGSGHDDVIGRGKDGVDLAHHAGRGGHDLIVGVACLFDVGNALGIEVSLGFGNGGRGVGFRVGVEQADGLDVRLDGKHHIHDGLGVQRIGGAGHIVNVGQVGGSGVGDRRIDDRGLGGLAGGGHALGGQRSNGDDRIIPIRDDLRADLVQRCGVILAVEVLVLDCNALLGSLGVQLGLNRHADLIEAGMIQLLHNGNLVALGSGIGCAFCGGGSCLGSGGRSGGIGSGAAGSQRGHHSGGGQNSNKLFHDKFSFICKTGNVVVVEADIDRPRTHFTNSGLPSFFHQAHFHASLSPHA